jgi:hypothetical protein
MPELMHGPAPHIEARQVTDAMLDRFALDREQAVKDLAVLEEERSLAISEFEDRERAIRTRLTACTAALEHDDRQKDLKAVYAPGSPTRTAERV